jgi:hypothetical protein
MSNEFVARNGFISNNDSVITGSLTVTNGLYGSTNTASYAISSSTSINAATASYVVSVISSSYSSYAETASNAITASVYLKPAYAPTPGIGYISPSLCFSEVTGAYMSTVGLDNIVLSPFLVNKDCTISRIGLSFASTSSGVTTTAKIAIYTDSGKMLPNTLLNNQSFGVITTTSSSMQYLESDPPLLTTFNLSAKTIYWIAVVGDNALRLPVPTINNGMYNPLLGVDITGSGTAFPNLIAVRNITNYVYPSGGAWITFPSSLPQTASLYTVNSRASQSMYVLPILNVTYG